MHYRGMASQIVVLLVLVSAAAGGERGASTRRDGPFPLTAAENGKVQVLAYDNGDASPWAEFFAFDSPGHAKLVRLRADYKLDEVIAGAKSDLERAVALKRWVGTHWKFSTPEPETFRDWSAVALLERGKRGKWGWCGQAAMIFQQAYLAVGLPARFIELGNETTPAGHFTTEVYLREHGKWAVVDATPLPDFDLYYTFGGVPQSALEMHRRVVRSAMGGVSEVHPGRTHKVEGRQGPAWSFYYLRWLTRCDVVTHTPKFVDMENVFDRRWHTVEWVDGETVPWEKQNRVVSWVRNERPSAWTTSDAEVLYWRPTDRVRMSIRPSETYLFFHLWSADLDFDHFEVAIDGRDWQRLPESNTQDADGPRFGWSAKRFSLPAASGVHEVRTRLVRRTGTKGPESFVKLNVARGPLRKE
ncbi:MAG: transglutaminase-like domain-containing protein [Thermoguttaceae bacterium]